MPETGKAIILGSTHGALAIARSLGKRGVPFMMLTYVEGTFALKSRYVKEWHVCPHPQDEDAFVEALLSYTNQWDGALIFATNDYFATALSQNKDRLRDHYRFVVADWEIMRTFLEKNRAYTLAEEVGVPHPRIAEPQTMQELESVIDQFLFPVMIKPVNSHEFVPIFKKKLIICDNQDELRQQFQLTVDAKQAVIISEIIPGTDYATLERIHTYFNSKGEPAAIFSNIKLRQTPPMYGVMRVGKSTPPNAEATELALKLLKAINYRGFASVEFKRDYRDNLLKLMEVNVRIPRSLQLPIASGIDFPWIIFQDWVHDEQIIIESYHEDTYLVEVLADITDFFLKDKDRSLSKFLQPYFTRHKSFSMLHFNDPMPFLAHVTNRGVRFIKKSLGIYNSNDKNSDE